MNKWVTPHLTGGLGNRLFEFAAAAGASELWDYPLAFHKAYITQNDHGPEDSICKLFPKVPVLEGSAEALGLPEPRGACFTYIPFPSPPPSEKIVIEGWRQTALYFPKSQPLQPVWTEMVGEAKMEEMKAKYGLVTEEDRQSTWFLHIRLGDYKQLPHHQINILPYYISCLDKLPRGVKLILFSDEPHLCAQWAENECKKRLLNFQVCEEEDEVVSLWLMSQIWGGAIVANSTFSWWGAYFARHSAAVPEAYVAYYPSVWGQGLPEARDVVPSWGKKVVI